MNPSQEYVNGLFNDLKRLREQEIQVIEKLIAHLQIVDKGLHERYMNLDTNLARLEERVRNLENGNE